DELFLDGGVLGGAPRAVEGGQVGPGGEGVGVVGAKGALVVGDELFLDGESLGGAPLWPEDGGQVASGGEGVGVVGAKDAFAVSSELHRDGDGLNATRSLGNLAPFAGFLACCHRGPLALPRVQDQCKVSLASGIGSERLSALADPLATE